MGSMAVPATLYGGQTNATGMQMPLASTAPKPILNGPSIGSTNPSSGTQMPVPPQAPAAPVSAPSGLTVSPTPGSTTGTAGTSTAGAVGTNTGTMSGLSSSDASRVLGENQNYLGQGMGALVTNYLQTGAGYNGPLAQQTINATDTAMQQQINQQYGALQTSLASAGLSPNSSASALAQSQFLSNASAQENEVAAQQYTQMYSQSQQDYLSMLSQLTGINNYGTLNQTTATGAIGSLLTGGVAGLLQYEGGAAGTAGNVTSSSGVLNSGGSTEGFSGAANAAASIAGMTF